MVNVNGTRHVVDAAKDNGCKALVYTSSCTVVTDDLNGNFPNIDERWPVSKRSSIYGESKAAAEKIVLSANSPLMINDLDRDQGVGNHGDGLLEHSMSTCVLRPSVIFGEGDTQLIPSIHACIQKGETRYKIGGGNNLWDTVYVGNVADAHVLAVENLLFHQPSSEQSNPTGTDNFGCGSIESGGPRARRFSSKTTNPFRFETSALPFGRNSATPHRGWRFPSRRD